MTDNTAVDAVLAEVRAEYDRGAAQAAGTSPAVVPSGEASSLSSGNAADKFILEYMMADPNSGYWKGTPELSAEGHQQLYRSLIEAEGRGEDAPSSGYRYEGADVDVPAKRTGYDYTGLPIHDGQTRDLVDEFAGYAHDSGFGVERTRDLLAWVLNQPAGVTEQQFRSWARHRGWSSTHISHAVAAYKDMGSRR